MRVLLFKDVVQGLRVRVLLFKDITHCSGSKGSRFTVGAAQVRVCELVMISRVYDDPTSPTGPPQPDEPYGPASAVLYESASDESYGPASAVPSWVRNKPRPLQDPHSSCTLRARLIQGRLQDLGHNSQLILVAIYLINYPIRTILLG